MLSCRWLLRLELLYASPSGTSRAASLSSQSSTRTSATSLWRFSTYFTASASPISENATSATRLKRSCVRPLRSSDKCQDGDQEASDRRDNTRWVRRVWLKGGVACAIEESAIISHREELSEGGTRAELRNLARRETGDGYFKLWACFDCVSLRARTLAQNKILPLEVVCGASSRAARIVCPSPHRRQSVGRDGARPSEVEREHGARYQSTVAHKSQYHEPVHLTPSFLSHTMHNDGF